MVTESEGLLCVLNFTKTYGAPRAETKSREPENRGRNPDTKSPTPRDDAQSEENEVQGDHRTHAPLCGCGKRHTNEEAAPRL